MVKILSESLQRGRLFSQPLCYIEHKNIAKAGAHRDFLYLDTGFALDPESVEDYLHDERTFHAFPIKPCSMYAG